MAREDDHHVPAQVENALSMEVLVSINECPLSGGKIVLV